MNTIIEYISQGIALVSVAIIVYGTIRAVVHWVRTLLSRDAQKFQRLRAEFGGNLLLGLELLIAADIIRTIAEPNYRELIVLASIVILRTILSVFLAREIKDLQ